MSFPSDDPLSQSQGRPQDETQPMDDDSVAVSYRAYRRSLRDIDSDGDSSMSSASAPPPPSPAPSAAPAAAPAVGKGSKRKRGREESRSKNYMGTLFFTVDPTPAQYQEFCDLFAAHVQRMDHYRGVSFQMERAASTGRLHIQWNILFKEKVGFSKLKADLEQYGKSPHIEVTARPEDAWNYTAKDETRVCGPFRHGQGPLKSGTRTDLVTFVHDCKALSDGKTTIDDKKMEEFEMKHLGVQAKYPRFYEKYVGKYETQRNWKTTTLVFWGEPGTGKTRFAHFLFAEFFRRNPATRPEVYSQASYPPSRTSHISWFYGYDQHDCVLFDEYVGQYSVETYKQLTGDTPFKVKIGNGQSERQWLPSLLINCSNADPDSWYGLRLDVRRRFDAVLKFDYHPDFPCDPSKGRDYALEVVRHAFITIDAPEVNRQHFVDQWAAFQASIPSPRPSSSPPVLPLVSPTDPPRLAPSPIVIPTSPVVLIGTAPAPDSIDLTQDE